MPVAWAPVAVSWLLPVPWLDGGLARESWRSHFYQESDFFGLNPRRAVSSPTLFSLSPTAPEPRPRREACSL